jgi:hypothetical protein
MFHSRHPARNIEIRSLLDTLFVSAVATILIIRLQLWATHYPKLGGGKLHIAHLLWGGLAMLVAVVVLLSFLSRGRRHTAAVLGGIGFGFFIDEIGKFVTSDNDYFFKPAAGMIYIVFIVLFLVIRSLGWRHRFTAQECLANAMVLLSEAAHRDLTERDRVFVRRLLEHSEHSEPLVEPLTEVLNRLECKPVPPPGFLARRGRRLRAWYFSVMEEPWFAIVLVAVFVAVAGVTLVQVGLDASQILNGHQHLHVISVTGLASSLVASGLILVGLIHLRQSRMAAYRWFDHALMVQVFFTEVFAFLENQFGAVFGLLLNLALLLTLRAMIHAEWHHAMYGPDALEGVGEELPSPGATVAVTGS